MRTDPAEEGRAELAIEVERADQAGAADQVAAEQVPADRAVVRVGREQGGPVAEHRISLKLSPAAWNATTPTGTASYRQQKSVRSMASFEPLFRRPTRMGTGPSPERN